jgi:RNA polymerase sigma-70 factor, ECF subfamily
MQSKVKQLCSDAVPMPTLVDRCAAGDEDAWRELFSLYHPVVLRFLRRMGLPPADAADAAQEVFVQVHRYVSRFEQRANLKTWLYKVCLSQASRRQRANKIQQAIRRLFRQTPAAPPLPSELPESEAQRVLIRAIEQLKSIHRDVFMLFEIEGLSGAEISRVLDCPVTTIWRRLHYARKELASILDNQEPREAEHDTNR